MCASEEDACQCYTPQGVGWLQHFASLVDRGRSSVRYHRGVQFVIEPSGGAPITRPGAILCRWPGREATIHRYQSQDLKARAQDLIDGLPPEFDKQACRRQHDRVTYHDNDSTGSVLSGGYKILDPNGTTEAQYFGTGPLNFAHFSREWFTLPLVGEVPLLIVVNWEEVVVLKHEHAMEVINSPLLQANGIAPSARILLEEMMHCVVEHLDLDITEQAEEDALQMVFDVVDQFIMIKATLQLEHPSWHDLYSLRFQ